MWDFLSPTWKRCNFYYNLQNAKRDTLYPRTRHSTPSREGVLSITKYSKNSQHRGEKRENGKFEITFLENRYFYYIPGPHIAREPDFGNQSRRHIWIEMVERVIPHGFLLALRRSPTKSIFSPKLPRPGKKYCKFFTALFSFPRFSLLKNDRPRRGGKNKEKT